MAKYSIELRHLKDSLFDFEYPYYDEENKCYFEEKFIEHYYFNEIGITPIQAFKQQLRAYLLRIMPLYKQKYQVELRCQEIDFMLNKDLKETFIRELDVNEENQFNALSKSNEEGNNFNNVKESNLEDGIAEIKIEQGYLTGATEDNNNYSNSSTNNSENNSNRQNREIEKTELLSQGNIGVTSSAELKDKWVKVLQNLDEEIILGARNLFMMVY